MNKYKLLEAPKVLRTHWYCMIPPNYDIQCPICKSQNIAWSEFEKHIWCYDCRRDILTIWKTGGIFSGPIPIKVAQALGLSFDRVNTKEVVKYCDDNVSEEYQNTWVYNKELSEYIYKLNNEKMENKKTNVSLKYVSKLCENSSGNKFESIPSDLAEFLYKDGGIMQPIVENLYPGQEFVIEIKIKSKKHYEIKED